MNNSEIRFLFKFRSKVSLKFNDGSRKGTQRRGWGGGWWRVGGGANLQKITYL